MFKIKIKTKKNKKAKNWVCINIKLDDIDLKINELKDIETI